jgi:hypothetical protein
MTRLLLIALLACPTTLAFGDEPLRGFDSPEAAIRAYAHGAAAADYRVLFSALTPEAQVRHLAVSVVTAAALHGDDRTMQLILDRHLPPLPVAAMEETQAEAQRRLYQQMWAVADRAGFAQEIADRHDQLLRTNRQAGDPTDADLAAHREADLKAAAGVRLDRLQLQEDLADADVALPPIDGVAVPIQHVTFRRIDGRWYCDDDPQ